MKMTVSSPANAAAERQTSTTENKTSSPNSSPRSSPKPSPRPQTKREHTKSDTYLTVNYKEPSTSSTQSKTDSSPGVSSQDLSGSRTNIIEGPPELSRSESTSAVKDRKDGRSKKKSAWYSVLYPTYKSRSEDFKRIFKEVPDEERLVVDYSCALQKEILVHGRLYVSQNYLCFYANIFGWETNVTIRWKDVSAITKEKTALVIPNAILIGTRSEKFFFTSFVARDKTYLMLFRVWQNALMDQPMTQQEMWQWVHQCYGDELGLTSDDEDYIAPGTEDDKFSASIGSFSEDGVSNIDCNPDTLLEEKMEDEKENINLMPSHLPPDNLNIPQDSHLPTDMSDTTESDAEKNSSPICTELHEGKLLLNEVFSLHIDQLFTLLFTSSKFFLDFHAARKTTDLTQTAWQHNPSDDTKVRTVHLTVALNQTMGPKTAQVTETQTMLPCSKAGHLYSVNLETVNGGVPYADSFCIFIHYCLHRVSATQSSLAVYAQIKYKKSVWGLVKGMIEKNCWQGLDDFYLCLGKSLHIEAEESVCPVRVPNKGHAKRRAPRIPRQSETERRPTKAKSTHRERKSKTKPSSIINIYTIVLFSILLMLLALNWFLYYKVKTLEGVHTTLFPSFEKQPATAEEWWQLIQQQGFLQRVEVKKWKHVIRTAVQVLRDVEKSFTQLQNVMDTEHSSDEL